MNNLLDRVEGGLSRLSMMLFSIEPWRRGWDSNPRFLCHQEVRLLIGCFRPLSHPAVIPTYTSIFFLISVLIKTYFFPIKLRMT